MFETLDFKAYQLDAEIFEVNDKMECATETLQESETKIEEE